MSTWILSLIVPLAIAVLWHGLSLKIACALAGEDSPGFLRAMGVSWLGGIGGGIVATVWSFTLGAVISLFLSSYLALGIGLLLQLFTVGLIYRKGLRLSLPAGVGVAGIHTVLSLVVSAALGFLTYTFLV